MHRYNTELRKTKILRLIGERNKTLEFFNERLKSQTQKYKSAQVRNQSSKTKLDTLKYSKAIDFYESGIKQQKQKIKDFEKELKQINKLLKVKK